MGEAESAPTQGYKPPQGTLYPQLQNHPPAQSDPEPTTPEEVSQGTQGPHIGLTTSTDFNAELRDIYDEVTHHGLYNYQGAQRRVPSGLCIEAWRRHLQGYYDANLVSFLEFGWPINFKPGRHLGLHTREPHVGSGPPSPSSPSSQPIAGLLSPLAHTVQPPFYCHLLPCNSSGNTLESY